MCGFGYYTQVITSLKGIAYLYDTYIWGTRISEVAYLRIRLFHAICANWSARFTSLLLTSINTRRRSGYCANVIFNFWSNMIYKFWNYVERITIHFWKKTWFLDIEVWLMVLTVVGPSPCLKFYKWPNGILGIIFIWLYELI